MLCKHVDNIVMAIRGSTHAMSDLYKQAQSRIPSSVLKPRHWIKSYEDFVQKNASQVSQIESALRSLTYILPGTPLNPNYKSLANIQSRSFQ